MSATRPKILAIDDTPANLMVLATALSDAFNFQLAQSGMAGLEMAVASPPDLILLDVMMPEVDGFETCRRFKANPRLAHIPVVFVTALTDNGSEVAGLKLGAVDYLHKPLNVGIARQRIGNLIEREALRREVEQHRNHLEQLVAERTAELRAANDGLVEARREAEVANRVKAALLANMSHELRTPLNVILGMTDSLDRQMNDPVLREKLRSIDYAGQQLLQIINDILFLARMEGNITALPNTPYHLRPVCEELAREFRRLAGNKPLTFCLAVGEDVPRRINGQPERLKQVLKHLLSNAVKFSSSGEVTLRVRTLQSGKNGPQLEWSVSDRGIGMEPGAIEEIFEAFIQNDSSSTRRHGGLGIGLAVVKHTTRLMGGEFGVDSTPGAGSCFWIRLPLETAAEAPVSDRGTGDGEVPAMAPTSSATIAITSAAPTPDVEAAIATMRALLEHSDMGALNVWRGARGKLMPALGTSAPDFQEYIEQFAFEEALQLLNNVFPDIPASTTT